MKRLIRVIILVVLVSAVILGVRWFLQAEQNQSASELRIYGNIDIRKADLAFIEQERIAQVLVEEGDRVTAGQVLATTANQSTGSPDQRGQGANCLPSKRWSNGSKPEPAAGDRAGARRGGGGKSHRPEFDD